MKNRMEIKCKRHIFFIKKKEKKERNKKTFFVIYLYCFN
jgi:hypothetical protein